jgi:hypothetical protein
MSEDDTKARLQSALDDLVEVMGYRGDGISDDEYWTLKAITENLQHLIQQKR